MVNPIPTPVRKLWAKWNIRGVILTSLFLQVFLILFAPLRKRTQRRSVTLSLWSAYLLADCAANFCVGLISDRRDDITNTNIQDYILAFWAPFLLLHLGGPDTITAFALEDNELWLRHLLGLLFQLGATVYVFLLTMPSNDLWIPTVLIFLSGIIKYTERTRSLYCASMNTFRHSMIRSPDAGPNYAKLMEEFSSKTEAGIPCSIVVVPEPDHKSPADDDNTARKDLSEVQVVRYAYYYFNKFKGLIVDMIYSSGDRNTSRDFFLSLTPEEAFKVIEVELNFIYEVFFTKASVLRSRSKMGFMGERHIGYYFRFVSFSCIVAALVLFTLHKKHGFSAFDVDVSYTLLYGALALEFMALWTIVVSDRTIVWSSDEKEPPLEESSGVLATRDRIISVLLDRKKPRWIKRSIWEDHPEFKALATCSLFRRWSGKVSGHNLIKYCLQKSRDKNPIVEGEWCYKVPLYLKGAIYKSVHYIWTKLIDFFGLKELVEKWQYKKDNPFLWELWDFIFQELKRKSELTKSKKDEKEVEAICTARGEWVIKDFFPDEKQEENLLSHVDPGKVAFDESLLLWHIATCLCYYDSVDPNKANTSKSNQLKCLCTKLVSWCSNESYEKVTEEKDYPWDKLRVLSKLLSDYMLYLSVMEPNVLSPVAGIGQLRFQDTCEEAIKFFRKRLEEEEDGKEATERDASKKLLGVRTVKKPIEVKGDRSKSLLFDGCILAGELNKLKENKWKIIAKVWVELLSYGASKCKTEAVVQQLSKGGELISFVWLLMVQLGLGTQFQIKEGHARAKLIAGESEEGAAEES